MTRDEFLDWVQTQELRYEFDGVQPVPMFDPSEPVAMSGATANHEQTCQNIYFALRTHLSGTGCRQLGPNAGVATVGAQVRFPDALVTCTRFPGAELLMPGVVVVFEVLSPTSGRMDRIVKVQEYRAVPSIRRYVILEQLFVGLTVFERADERAVWTGSALAAGDVLRMSEIGIEVPVDEFYESVDLP